jgi:broad specificity phosphatase PhoE
MRIILHLVRHAEGVHNLSWPNENILDPDLTPLGRQQCKSLGESFPHRNNDLLLVASPLRRTIETCLLSFHRPDMPKIIAMPELQEVGTAMCDIGLDLELLRTEYGERVELSRVMKGWEDKSPGSRWEPKQTKLEIRAAEARKALRELGRAKAAEAKDGEIHVVAVSHGGILHFVTDDWHGIPKERGVSHPFRTSFEVFLYCFPCQNMALAARLRPFSLTRSICMHANNSHRMEKHGIQILRIRGPRWRRFGCGNQGDDRELGEEIWREESPLGGGDGGAAMG